ncbi:predicted protein [Chaetomium globosum CBS 148.51]|uniref:Uncharacterized protein n=1 Tax=Chaetomium globosum (strain ATCC 6205 / CBS 148.51 / DSM 1962 / NBRC 6347 / NRRL 1970) TaxID=306901 RepID=Q2HD94_CHAGB|nr:uncharacterized protein CHGG_01810 [Chaetomium globosum CBS 148.51]EAQ93575.1 predicted protein [Chaetomium globosum CBS 148.51]
MDFINHLRQLQADESSSDEEPGRILTAAAVTAPPAKPPAATTTPPAQPAETKAPTPKRKREAPAEAAPEGIDAETRQAAKRAKLQLPTPPASTSPPSPLANGTPSPKKKGVRAAEEKKAAAAPPTTTTTTTKTHQPKAASIASSSKAPAPAAAATKDEPPEKAATTVAARAPRKPLDQMEFFERRVHDMLTRPLDFDDCVLDTARPIPRHAARSFAQYRRRQPQPAPPLVMSGALRPVSKGDVKVGAGNGGGGGGRSKGSSGSTLAMEARKNAHRLNVKERGQELKGKARAGPHGKGAVVGKQSVVSRPDGGRGKERQWLSNARQTGGNGGQQHLAGGKKSKKFA